jgi:glycerate kinase
VKILVAPDKFKDALDAASVAEALAAGARQALSQAEIVTCPLADGGEGTGRLLAEALGARQRTIEVLDPLGRPRIAAWWLCPERRLAIVEMAEASGLALLKPEERDPLRTTTYGTGQLLQAAIDAGCLSVLLCVGGSATVDGGAGCLQGLGCRLADHAGDEIREPASGGTLTRVAGIRWPRRSLPADIEILCDVDNPLLGPRGAAPVFGPQKGATPAAVRALDDALLHWARIIEADLGRRLLEIPGTGAAGGLPFGLLAAFDAHLLSGFAEVAHHVRLREKLSGCDLCLTGEGRIDEQTVGGKVVAGVARLAAARRVPVWAFAGAVRLGSGQNLEALAQAVGVEQIVVISPPETPLADALAATATNLHRAARECLIGGR